MRRVLRILLVSAALLGLLQPVASAQVEPYRTNLTFWRASAGRFADWRLAGVRLAADGALELDAAHAARGQDPYPRARFRGHAFYNDGAYVFGEALSPVVPAPFTFYQAIASWNAAAPPGTWLEIAMRARVAPASAQGSGHWTGWYDLGVWAADDGTLARHSVDGQKDADGDVAVDTLVLDPLGPGADAYQLSVRLFSAGGAPAAVPRAPLLALALSTTPHPPATFAPGNPALWGRELALPSCSQMVYQDGGEVWCSPTSTAMVLGFWAGDSGACEPGVRASVAGVYDWLYDGHGNWPFNTAYAADHGLEAVVARFTSLAQAEDWIAAGVPVVATFAWNQGELDGALFPWSDGHLAVIVGFDAQGNPIMHDPGAPTDAEVRIVYPREQFERLWLQDSGGAVYLIYPPGWKTPPLP
jgi:hypothetical protein